MEGNYPGTRGRQDPPRLASQCCYAAVKTEQRGRETWGSLKGEAWQTVGKAEASSAVLSAEGAFNSLSNRSGERKGWKMGENREAKKGDREEGREKEEWESASCAWREVEWETPDTKEDYLLGQETAGTPYWLNRVGLASPPDLPPAST